VVFGLLLVILGIIIGGDLVAYLNAPSVLIVIGGATMATLTAFPLAVFLQLPKVTMKAIFNQTQDPVVLIAELVELAEVARRDGILALENRIDQMTDPFLISGIQMAVDGTDPEVIESVMETELGNLMERHLAGKGLLDALGRYAPAFGMIGTLIGLVAMLSGMDDPSKIGAGMAAALLTTLYGAVLANIVFLPIADKLSARSSDEVLLRTIIIKGVMAIQSGDNPRNVESKLRTFLPPTSRAAADAKAA
jgi:chemotaxis protein MotA